MPSRDKDSNYWLFIEPYVHIACVPEAVMFYNTLTGKRSEYHNLLSIIELANLLNKPENGYVVPLSASQLQTKEIKRLVKDLRAGFMGDILETAWSEGKPSNIFPSPMVKAKLTPKILQKPDRLKEIEFDNYLHEVSVYLNSHKDTGSDYPQASRQFLSPFIFSDQPANLPLDYFKKFVYQADTFKIVALNISGANIFEYPHLREIIEAAASYPFQKKYHVPATGIGNYYPILESLASEKETMLCFYVTFPANLGKLNQLLTFISEKSLARKCEFHFIVTSNEEFEASREIIEQAQLHSVFFKPYYTGHNFLFFREMVFITREDIRHSKPDQYQVFSRISINEKDFGKLTLMPDGSVYANPNDDSLGSIATDPLSNIVLNALITGKSWKRNRKNVTPCRKCLYHFLCPPISSYEILMRRYNFCDIYQKPRNQ